MKKLGFRVQEFGPGRVASGARPRTAPGSGDGSGDGSGNGSGDLVFRCCYYFHIVSSSHLTWSRYLLKIRDILRLRRIMIRFRKRFRVAGRVLSVHGVGFRALESRCNLSGSRFRVSGVALRVEG